MACNSRTFSASSAKMNVFCSFISRVAVYNVLSPARESALLIHFTAISENWLDQMHDLHSHDQVHRTIHGAYHRDDCLSRFNPGAYSFPKSLQWAAPPPLRQPGRPPAKARTVPGSTFRVHPRSSSPPAPIRLCGSQSGPTVKQDG